MEMLVFWLVMAGVVAIVANSKGKSPLAWFFYGFLIWPIALVHILVTKPAAQPSPPPPVEETISFSYFGQTIVTNKMTGRASVAGQHFPNVEAAKAHIDQLRASPPPPAPTPPAAIVINHGGQQILINPADGTASVDGINFATPADAQTYIDRLAKAGSDNAG